MLCRLLKLDDHSLTFITQSKNHGCSMLETTGRGNENEKLHPEKEACRTERVSQKMQHQCWNLQILMLIYLVVWMKLKCQKTYAINVSYLIHIVFWLMTSFQLFKKQPTNRNGQDRAAPSPFLDPQIINNLENYGYWPKILQPLRADIHRIISYYGRSGITQYPSGCLMPKVE